MDDEDSSRPVSWSSGMTFTYHSLGNKPWKFHGGNNDSSMTDEKSNGCGLKRTLNGRRLSVQESGTNRRKLTRTHSVGSVCSSSESECSSQASMGSPDAEDIAKDFLNFPTSPTGLASTNEATTSSACELLIETPSSDISKSSQTFKAKILPTPNFSLSGLVKILSSDENLNGNGIEIIQSNKALALRLQQRRPRKILADQGIIPPLKSPATYYEQRQKLERARTGDILNKKIQLRPERDTLIAKHILEDTQAYDSIVASQKELKKAKLVDDLNEKIAFRPGVFDLVKKNIIQTDDNLQEAIKDGQVQFCDDGDSSDAFSPDPSSQSSQGDGASTSPSIQLPRPPKPVESSPPLIPRQQGLLFTSSSNALSSDQSSWNNNKHIQPTSRQDSSTSLSQSSNKITTSSSHPGSHPYLFRQTSGTKNTKPAQSTQRNVRKQRKEKPKFKRYKYHQYVPPDQQGKQNSNTDKKIPSMNAHYARVLEEQQLYLQFEIMKQHYPTILPSPKATGDKQLQDINKSYIQHNVIPSPPPPPPPPSSPGGSRRNNNGDKRKRIFTEQQLEDMKVAELKEELKARGLKVTGTKEVLVERLRPFAIQTMQGSMLQPISRSIAGLINATIQSTQRAHAEQAAAASSSTSASGSIMARTSGHTAMFKTSEPIQKTVSHPTVMNTTTNQSSNNTFTIQTMQQQQQQQQKTDSRPGSVVPMDAQMDTSNIQRQVSNSTALDQNFQFVPSEVLHVAPPRPVLTTISTGQPVQNSPWVITGSDNNPTGSNNFRMNNNKDVKSGGNPLVIKDQLLQEIEDLRRMVDLHRTQLRQIQKEKEQNMNENSNLHNTNANEATQSMYQQQQDTSSVNLAEATSALNDRMLQHQQISQMLQQHLQNKMQKGPMYTNDVNQSSVKQERSPPMMVQENHYNFANSPPNVSLVPLKSSNERIPSPNVMQPDPNQFQGLSTQETKAPPKYDQAIQEKHRQKRFIEGGNTPGREDQANMYMDDLLELLADKGELPLEEQQRISSQQHQQQQQHLHQKQNQQQNNFIPQNNNQTQFPQQARLRNHNQSMNSQQKLQMRRSFPILDYDSNTNTWQVPKIETANDAQNQVLSRRHSSDILSQPSNVQVQPPQNTNHGGQSPSQFTTHMLVSSAGDVLMDNNLVPPPTISHRVHQPGCIPPEAVTIPQYDQRNMYNNMNYMFSDGSNMPPRAAHHSGSNPNLLSMEDPYNAQPFSPMDTNSCDGSRSAIQEDRTRDPHLSASSIHDSETSLDKACNVAMEPNNTASFLRKYEQPLAGESPSHNNSLIKSASQELLSTSQHNPNDQTMQVDELKWLDLTLGSPLPGPSMPLQHGQNYHSNESILDSDSNGENSIHLSTSLQSFESPSAFIGGTDGVGPNEFSIDLMDLNSINSPNMSNMDPWDKMLSS